MTPSNQKLEFREVTCLEELKKCFRQRYEIALETGYPLIKNNSDCHMQMEFDQYDLYSRHYGLFDKNCGKCAGYFRLITTEVNNRISGLGIFLCQNLSKDELVELFVAKEQKMLAFLHKDQGQLDALITKYVDQSFTVMTSRIFLHRSVRSLGLIRVLLELAFASGRILGVQRAIHTCNVPHERFYKQFGFYQVEGFEIVSVPGLLNNLLMEVDPWKLPVDLESHVSSLEQTLFCDQQVLLTQNGPGKYQVQQEAHISNAA